MAKILVYNNDTNRMLTFYRELSQAMPYNVNRTLTIREFRIALDIYMEEEFMLALHLKDHGKEDMENFHSIMQD